MLIWRESTCTPKQHWASVSNTLSWFLLEELRAPSGKLWKCCSWIIRVFEMWTSLCWLNWLKMYYFKFEHNCTCVRPSVLPMTDKSSGMTGSLCCGRRWEKQLARFRTKNPIPGQPSMYQLYLCFQMISKSAMLNHFLPNNLFSTRFGSTACCLQRRLLFRLMGPNWIPELMSYDWKHILNIKAMK